MILTVTVPRLRMPRTRTQLSTAVMRMVLNQHSRMLAQEAPPGGLAALAAAMQPYGI